MAGDRWHLAAARRTGVDLALANDQAITEVELRAIHELTVLPSPSTRLQIGSKLGETRIQVPDLREDRDCGPDASAQVRVRTAPVRAEEPIRAIVRNGNVEDARPSEVTLDLGEIRHRAAIYLEDLREVVREPEPAHGCVEGKDDHRLAGSAAKLREASRQVGPVVKGEDSK